MTAVPTGRTTPALDVAVAAGFVGLAEVEIWVFRTGGVPTDAQVLATVAVAVMGVTLALRSTAPVPAYFVNGLAIYATTLIGVPSDIYPFSNLALLYSMATVATTPVALLGLVFGLAGVTAYFWVFVQQLLFGALTLLLWALAWAAGRSTLARRARVALEHERELAMATAEAREARLALESQRRLLAREVHDLVGHSINVMVVHAGAGRRAVETDPSSARRALETIEEVGTAALDELDGLLGMLGQQHQDRAPLPGVADVAGLVERMRRSGLRVELHGSLDDDVGAPVGATIYRVVQEALTNTLKHADASTAVVELRRDGTTVTVHVADDGRGANGPPGRGLAGMAGRVAMHGGSLEHGDRPTGGYTVTARIPVEGLA